MTSQGKWEGNVFTCPIEHFVNKELVLPPGPSESAPFDSGEWHTQLRKLKTKLVWDFWRTDGENVDSDVILQKRITKRVESGRGTRQSVMVCNLIAPLDKAAACVEYTVKHTLYDLIKTECDLELIVVRPCRSANLATPAPAPHLISQISSNELPFDVQFTFPGSGHSLWSNSNTLKAKSTYFDSLISKLTTGQAFEPDNDLRRVGCGSNPLKIALDPRPVTHPGPDLDFFVIKITSPDYDTFKAIISWIHTDQIDLSSSMSKPSSDGTAAVAPPQAKRIKLKPELAPPAPGGLSPVPWQTAFEVAHTLGISGLDDLALAQFAASLAVDNVALELFGPLSLAYPAVRKVAMDYAVEHWAEVEKTEGLRKTKEALQRGEVVEGDKIRGQLSLRVH